MSNRPVKNDPALLKIARTLRQNMTRQERHLWYDFLRYYPVKVYKQRVIDSYVVDFYCHQARLVIELDGSQHYASKGVAYDEKRTKVLEQYGLFVLRFSNSDVDEQFEGVCTAIDRAIHERCRPDGTPEGEPYLPPPPGEVAER